VWGSITSYGVSGNIVPVQTRTVGSGALEGQEIVQKYRDNQKVNDGNTTNNTDTNTKEAGKCDPLKTNLCAK
ncbi:hypothetical protein, partial [uncultured Moraxella sp.]|uniref:hypothetical protein n=1 Tax=uncultured Moraxella sp. TaxID=263769 RepID=UPI0025E5F6FB